MKDRKRWADEDGERSCSKSSGRFLSRLLRDEPTTVFCSRELRLRSLPLAPVFPLALPPNPHVLIFPGISAFSLRLCKGLYRGVDRSSCSSTYPEIRCLYYAPNFVFSAVNFDRAISYSYPWFREHIIWIIYNVKLIWWSKLYVFPVRKATQVKNVKLFRREKKMRKITLKLIIYYGSIKYKLT